MPPFIILARPRVGIVCWHSGYRPDTERLRFPGIRGWAASIDSRRVDSESTWEPPVAAVAKSLGVMTVEPARGLWRKEGILSVAAEASRSRLGDQSAVQLFAAAATAAAMAGLSAFLPCFRGTLRVVLEVAATRLAALLSSFGGPLGILGEVAFPTLMLSHFRCPRVQDVMRAPGVLTACESAISRKFAAFT